MQLEIRAAKGRMGLLFAVSLVFVAMGFFIVVKGGNPMVALATMGFFGLCAAVFAWKIFFQKTPDLVLDAEGLSGQAVKKKIPWVVMEDVWLNEISTGHTTTRVISLQVQKAWLEAHYPKTAQYRWLSNAMQIGDVGVPANNLALKPGVLVEIFKEILDNPSKAEQVLQRVGHEFFNKVRIK